MDRSLWVIISLQAEPVLSIRTPACALTCALLAVVLPFVRRVLATRTCQFMRIRPRACLCTREYAWSLHSRVFAWRKIKYANLRAPPTRLTRCLWSLDVVSSVGYLHGDVPLAPLIISLNNEYQSSFFSKIWPRLYELAVCTILYVLWNSRSYHLSIGNANKAQSVTCRSLFYDQIYSFNYYYINSSSIYSNV